jgi:nucleoside-diphosphate-sugar epimerase
MMKALVTGIGGFTGRYIAQSLLSRDIVVTGLSHSQCALPGVNDIHVVDMSDKKRLAEIVEECKPNYVVHLAAISFILHSNVEEIYRTNVIGTRNLLAALTDSGLPLESVLIASSSNVYGNRTEGLLREDSPLDPVNDYAVSKVSTELVAGLFRDKLPIIVTRPFNYTGIGQSEKFLIPKIVAKVRSRCSSILLGNLNIARDFSDVRFVSEAYCRLLTHQSAIGETVNVSSGRAYRISDIIKIVSDIAGYNPKIDVDPALVRSNDVRQLWGNSSRLDRIVGPIERIELEDTLRWMITETQTYESGR